MSRTLAKTIVILLTLLSFTGQMLAYSAVVLCNETEDQHAAVATEHEQDQEHQAHQDNSDSDCCEDECCEPDCLCITGACASVLCLVAGQSHSQFIALSEHAYLVATGQPKFTSALPYRPPIFAS